MSCALMKDILFDDAHIKGMGSNARDEAELPVERDSLYFIKGFVDLVHRKSNPFTSIPQRHSLLLSNQTKAKSFLKLFQLLTDLGFRRD